LASLLVLAAVGYLGYQLAWTRPSVRNGFDRVAAGMSEEQVREVLGPPGDYQSDWRPRVSAYAEAWQIQGGEFFRREYRGLEVHTAVGLSGKRFLVWRTDEAIVLVEFDGNDRVYGKIWLAE
jgi:hypothetical protein